MRGMSVLVVEDDKMQRQVLCEYLQAMEYDVYDAGFPSRAFEFLGGVDIDIVLLDISLPEMSGLEALKAIKASHSDIEVIMITGSKDLDTAQQAVQFGAFDFFNKPLRLNEIRRSLERTKKHLELLKRLRNVEYNYDLVSRELQASIGNVVGTNKLFRAAIDLAMRAAIVPDTSVIIRGPSGSGKEAIARMLHYAGPRAAAPFVPVNCSAIPESLLESEFFGHKKGSFTGAIEDKAGIFEAANGGTVFLDEIGDMPLAGQVKLLRVLQDRRIKRIGSNREILVDVRVVAATNQDLWSLIASKGFREDLYFRLNTIEIVLPALADRPEDIPVLLNHFLMHYSRRLRKRTPVVSKSVYTLLAGYPFPGNVRELANMAERAIILCDGKELGIEHFPLVVAGNPGLPDAKPPSVVPDACSEGPAVLDLAEVSRLEQRILTKALEQARYNKTQAAELLSISRYALDRKLKRFGML